MIGSLGILISAKQAGLISKVKPKIEKIANSRVYLSQTLIEIILETANEK